MYKSTLMDIKDVLSIEELEERFNALINSNWKVKGMADGVEGKSAKEKIDNWFPASRKSLLEFLSIYENESFRFVYHAK